MINRVATEMYRDYLNETDPVAKEMLYLQRFTALRQVPLEQEPQPPAMPAPRGVRAA